MTLRTAFSASALLLLGALVSACAPSVDSESPTATDVAPGATGVEAIRANLTRLLPGAANAEIRATDADGLYEIQSGSNFAYVTADGKYLIEGDLFELASGKSLTEDKRKTNRVAKLNELGTDNMIVYSPTDGTDPERVVTVFTDIDCGYCRKLHREINEYTALGIEIRYAFYPRSGPNTDSFRKAEAVWCSADRKDALTTAKAGAPLPATTGTDCENPITREYALGSQLGLRGTPMLILPDGEVVNGYMPPAALAEHLSKIQAEGQAQAKG
ncbi:MAG: DsbC family protein [Pseudomonadota bacterium]|nr:DsbC family protein [Pseudomonadota bacterium]